MFSLITTKLFVVDPFWKDKEYYLEVLRRLCESGRRFEISDVIKQKSLERLQRVLEDTFSTVEVAKNEVG